MAYRYPEYFEPSRPREAKGGIKAQSGRGGFGRSWWARRWIEVLEGLGPRSEARSRQVLCSPGPGAVDRCRKGRRNSQGAGLPCQALPGRDQSQYAWQIGLEEADHGAFRAAYLCGKAAGKPDAR